MSKYSCLKISLLICCLPLINSCAPLVPDNYLGPSNIQKSQVVNGVSVRPRLIPISYKMLNSSEGQQLLVPAMRPQPYRIGAFDNLNIIVWGHPEISTISTSSTPATTTINGPGAALLGGSAAASQSGGVTNPAVLVQTDGRIFYPYVGHLKIAGLTIDQAQRAISKRLSAYIRDPQVTVQVAKYRNRNIYVLGEVAAAGLQPITDKPLTLLEAISNAGGITAGSADPTHIYLIRGSYVRPDIFWLNAQSPQSLLIAQRFPLQENDIVYVSAATFNSWNKFMGTVFPTFTTFWTIKGLSNIG